MLDYTTLPKVIIKPGVWGSVEIKKNERYYTIHHSDEIWNTFNVQNMRELHEQWSGYDLAYGDVLVSGFGFGHITCWLANKPEVTSVTVVEISQDIIDAFLESNTLPKKVNIVIADMNTYQPNRHYDCIIFDHISNYIKEPEFYVALANKAKAISHNLFWFWSIEFYYLRYYYDIMPRFLYATPFDFAPYDFSTKWEDLRKQLDITTIPSLSKDKIDAYVNSYFLRNLLHKELHQ